MFQAACKTIEKSLYGTIGVSVIKQSESQASVNSTSATAFMVSDGYLITAAHFVHQENNPTKPIHKIFEVIRALDIGQKMEKAAFIGEDKNHDIALLKIIEPKNNDFVKLKKEGVQRGINCGFLGFPLANVQFMPNGQRNFSLFERFQGAYISNLITINAGLPTERKLYEVDNMMYSGSSGCPAFDKQGEVIGMQVASVMQKRKEDDQTERVAISLVVPSTEIIAFLKSYKIEV